MEEWASRNRSLILKKVISRVPGLWSNDISPQFFQHMDLLFCKMMYKIEFHNYARFNHNCVAQPYTDLHAPPVVILDSNLLKTEIAKIKERINDRKQDV